MSKLLCIILLLTLGCNRVADSEKQPVNPPVLKLLPLGDIDSAIVKKMHQRLQQHFPVVELLPAEPLPSIAWYAPRSRYRADAIIKWLQERASVNEKYIAITTKDISTEKGSIKDYGIMGLAYRPGKAAVASNFRLRDKNNFFKVVIHELAHTNGLPHCDDSSCYLRDAKGGDHTSKEKSFCETCTAKLKGNGWRL